MRAISERMRIVKNKKDKNCLFCAHKLLGNNFLEVNTPFLKNNSGNNRRRFSHQCHLSCGYEFLKQLTNKNKKDEEIIKILEEKYPKQIILEKLKE
jgi:hypothetical protein